MKTDYRDCNEQAEELWDEVVNKLNNMKTIKLDGVGISEDKLREIIKNNPELVELGHIKKGRWKPTMDESFYYIGNVGVVMKGVWLQDLFGDCITSEWLWNTNNVFRTREEAEQRKAEIEALTKINDYIEENKLGWNKKESDGFKYELVYNYNEFDWTNYDDDYSYPFVLPPLKSKESAQEIIDKFEEELKVVFKIK